MTDGVKNENVSFEGFWKAFFVGFITCFHKNSH
jgi:hypothetical protein